MKRMAPRLLKECEMKAAAVIAKNVNHPIGPEMVVTDFLDKVQKYRNMVNDYNILLVQAELTRTAIRQHEKEVRELKERVRNSIIVYSGKSSNEYKAFIRTTKAKKKPKSS